MRARLRAWSPALRSFVAGGTVALAVLALGAAAALFLTSLHYERETTKLAGAVSDLRALEELQVNLLIHQRATGRLDDDALHVATRRRAEAAVRHWLARARDHTLDEREPAMLSRLEQSLDRYWREHVHPAAGAASEPGWADGALEQTLAAIRSFTDHHYQQSEKLAAEARRLARLTLVGSASVAAGLVVVVLLFLLLTHGLLYLPLLRLRDGVGRAAAAGDRPVGPALETGVRELREIGWAFDELRSSLAAQEHLRHTFLAGVAHDLRNPLAAVKAAAAAIEAQHPDERQQRASAIVRRQVDRMNRMLEDLLACASIEAGKLRLAPGPCDLRSVVEEVVALHQPLARELTARVPPSPVTVVCDAQRLEQALGNLVANAIKHAGDGPIRVTLESSGEQAVIAVEDHGPGIGPETRRCLFQPFCRPDATPSRGSGAGLGLFVARRIVEAHGGRIELESEPGRGSTFRVCLRREPLLLSCGEETAHVAGVTALATPTSS